MFESVIELVMKERVKQFDELVEGELWKAIEEIGVVVNREELIKALQYDRDQYSKGYEDGKREFAAKLKARIDDLVEEMEGV